MSMAIVEFIAYDDSVVLRATVPSGGGFDLELTADEAREFSNTLGEAILHVSNGADMDDFAGWVQDAEAEVVEQHEPVAAPWLPASVVRAQVLEDAAEAREDRARERERADRAEQAHDAAVAAHLAAAAMRGEYPSPMEVAAGSVGRPLMDVLEAARGDLTEAYRPQAPADERFYGEPQVQAKRSSAWTSSSRSFGHDSETPGEYERDSLDDHLLRRARELHLDLVHFRGQRDHAAAMEAARAKSDAAHGRVTRSAAQRQADYEEYGREVTRAVPMIGWK